MTTIENLSMSINTEPRVGMPIVIKIVLGCAIVAMLLLSTGSTAALAKPTSYGNPAHRRPTMHVKDTGSRATEANWTFLVYLDADCDLETDGIDDFNEMEAAGSTAAVNIVALFDRWDDDGYRNDDGDENCSRVEEWTDARYYHVQHDTDPDTIASPVAQNLGEVNMGDPQTLVDFFAWTQTHSPAEHYAIILWDHGEGYTGCCFDDSHEGDGLTIDELRSALTTIKTMNNGSNIDLVGFDACNMAMLEVMYECMDAADYFVGSEETEPNAGWCYTPILANLSAHPEWTGAELGAEITDAYIESYTDGEESDVVDDDLVTQSTVDLTALDPLLSAVDTLALELIGAIENDPTMADAVAAAAAAAETYEGGSKDLHHLMQQLDASTNLSAHDTAIQTVMDAVNDAVYRSRFGPSCPAAHGIAIYYP